MVVIPVEFEDREFTSSRAEQEALVQQAESYFNRQFSPTGTCSFPAGRTKAGAEGMQFQFELGPLVRLGHETAWYGADYPDRRDVRLGDAVREACTALQGQVDWPQLDIDGDGAVDNVLLLYAGTGQHESGAANDIFPQQARLSAGGGNPLIIRNIKIDKYAVAPEGRLGILCHEFGHVLGLPDLYDTDGEQSGGLDPGLGGLSLMDDGCRKAVPPDFGAIEFELLGLGRCDTLSTGTGHLTPLLQGRRYLKALTDRKDEYFLFEARADGLYVFHVDRSENPAGFSPGHDKELTARDRWDYGIVNNNPAHPCARPVVTGGYDPFGSDTPAPFRAWSGTAPGLALTDLRPDGAGGLHFTVLQPLTLTEISVYQDASVLRWKADPAMKASSITICWCPAGEGEPQRREVPADASSCTLEGLHPGTLYHFSVTLNVSERDRYSADGIFSTKVQRDGTYPYIYLSGATRNVDGSFPPGSKLPLRVFNATDVEAVEWTLDGIRIAPEADGRYTLRKGGTLRAKVFHSDGTSETLFKEITVQ